AAVQQGADGAVHQAHIAPAAAQPCRSPRGRHEPFGRIRIHGLGGEQNFPVLFASALFGYTHVAATLPARLGQSNKRPPVRVTTPPRSLCILRLSALGDVSHVVPLVRTVQRHWPETSITWIIGRFETRLVGDI